MASKIVSPDRLGRILACFSFVNVLSTMLTPLMSYTYSETVEWNPGFVYCLLCGILGISLLLSSWVFVKQRRLLKKYKKEGKIVPFLHHKAA